MMILKETLIFLSLSNLVLLVRDLAEVWGKRCTLTKIYTF